MQIAEKNVKTRYGTDTAQERHDHARGPSSYTAIASFDLGASRTVSSQ